MDSLRSSYFSQFLINSCKIWFNFGPNYVHTYIIISKQPTFNTFKEDHNDISRNKRFSRAELPSAISDQIKLQQSWNLFFQDFILEHYSEDGADYENAIAEFMDIRQAMRTPTRDANGISLLFEHFNQLYFVERRFFPPDRSLGIYFEW